MSRLGLLFCGLLVLPHHASAASIPLVFTFDTEGVAYGNDVVGLSPIKPIVFHVVLTFNDVVESIRTSREAWVEGQVGGVQFEGFTFPQLPAPKGTQIGDSLSNSTDEWRYASWYGTQPGFQFASAAWTKTDIYSSELGPWTSVTSLGIRSQSRRLFTSPDMDLGTPTVQSALETLAWGGTVGLQYGWSYNAAWESRLESGPVTDVSIRYLTGTYALDTAATVPEPASLLMLASGLALFRLRR